MNTQSAHWFTTLLATGCCLLAATGRATPADGMVVGTTKVVDNGPAADRYNIVVIAEGYTNAQLSDFADHADEFAAFLFATPPFDVNFSAINIYRVDVRSDDSGTDDPAACAEGTGAMVDTYFDGTLCTSGVHRLLTVNSVTAEAVADAEVPEWDQVLVIVNSAIHGGAGGSIAVTSVAGTWELIAIHEFGHSGFDLADEYDYFLGCGVDVSPARDNHPGAEPSEPNVTIETDPALIKWKDLILGSTTVPTTENGDCSVCDPQDDPFPGLDVVGLYEGADYYHCDAYRPVFRCMMRDFDRFCPVCTRQILTILEPYQPFGPNAHMMVMLDRSGSMDQLRETGNTRCHDALEQAKLDVEAFTFANPGRLVAVSTFSQGGRTDVSGGFVTKANALNALDSLNGVVCKGLTPLAEATCEAIDEFPAAVAAGDRLMAISSDGGENNSGGPCAGPDSNDMPPPAGNYTAGSWQQKVYDKLAGEAIVNIRHWGRFGKSGRSKDAGVDVETGRVLAKAVPFDVFFNDVATRNSGSYSQIDDGDVPEACINCTPENEPPFECTGAETPVTLSSFGFSLDGPVLPLWTEPKGGACSLTAGQEDRFIASAECKGTGDFAFTMTMTLDEDEDGVPEAGEETNACDLLVTVQDTIPPALNNVPPDELRECNQLIPPPAPVFASDICDADIDVLFGERQVPLHCPDAFVLFRTWTATDESGNVACPDTQALTVLDTTPPVLLNVPPNATLECDAVPLPAPVTAVDNCDLAASVDFCEERTDGVCEDSYQLTRTWTGTDRCGNAASEVQLLDVEDTTPPVPMAALEPTVPRSPQSPGSACSPLARRTFQVVCSATDNCDPAPGLNARLLVTNHAVGATESCSDEPAEVPVECGEVVEIQLIEPPCPADGPRSAPSAVVVNAAGIKSLTGERVELEVTATDRCDNVATDRFDPATEPSTLCDEVLVDDTCCSAVAPPASAKCKVALCD